MSARRPSPRAFASLRATVWRALALCAALLLGGCGGSNEPPELNVKDWKSWTLPTDGPTQPTPRSLATGPNNELAVMDTAGRILIYDAEHTLLRQWKMLDVRFGKPEGIVWLKDNRIVVCDTHYHRLVWFDSEGKVLRLVGQRGEGQGEFIFPVGMTKDAAENLYVCEYGGHDRVQVFSREGVWLREFGKVGIGPGEFQRASGLTWHEGKVYVADAVNHRISIFQDNGTYVGILGTGADGKSGLELNLPYDVSLGPDNALYIVEYGAGRLTKASLDGKLLARYGKTGTEKGEFATPWGLTVDKRSRVIVADTRNRRLVMLQL
jgi:iron(III) transport system ATP-binding protein